MKILKSWKPLIGVLFLQIAIAGLDFYIKVALNEGMSPYVFAVYRHAVATLVITPFAVIIDRTKRPKLTTVMVFKFALLGLLGTVTGQTMFTLGLTYTTATFASAMCNILPAMAFILAWVFRLENLKFSSIRTHAKVLGTIATVAGAMIMTFVKGPIFQLFKKTEAMNHGVQNGANSTNVHNVVKGSILIVISEFSYACFMIFQALTIKTYPAELSLSGWICLFGTAEGAIVALVMERKNTDVWDIHLDNKLYVALYSGIVCSGLTYYIQGIIMRHKGPVFVTAFNPLSMVIVAILGSFILGEKLFLGEFIGAVVIIVGLYLVLWGKSKECKSSSQPAIDDRKAEDHV